MGIFLDKIVKPLFRSQKGNWVSRINELTDSQLKIAHSGQTEEEKEADDDDDDDDAVPVLPGAFAICASFGVNGPSMGALPVMTNLHAYST